MTTRELDLAKLAAAKLTAPVTPPKPARVPKPRSTGVAAAFHAQMQAANAEYEARKQHGATLAAIERKHGLTPRSLNNWRSYRMIHQTEPIRRTYLNRK
jgi:hypothetical protein